MKTQPPPLATVLAAAAALAITLPAAAQSTLTLSGVADAAVRHVANDGLGSVKSLVSGANATSRLVFRGQEDLGGGLSAGFHLEHGFTLDNGTPTAGGFWDRRSTLSLSAKALGELRLGRDFVPSYVGWSRYDPFGYVGVAGSNNLVSATPDGPIRNAFGSTPNTTVRSSNAVQWLLPAGLAGVEGGVMVAAGEGGVAANGQHKLIGARLGWSGGLIGLSLAHTTSANDRTAAGRFKDTALGGSWNAGPARLSAAWRQFSQADARQRNLLLGAVMPLGSGDLKLSWVRVDLSGRVGASEIDANGTQQLGLGYVHHLSKRTALYATAARIANDGAATYVVPGGASGIAGGKRSTGVEAGLRHSF